MSTQLAISCPHCAATLKLKNNTFVGKKVPCPKCKKPFVVEQPPEDEFLAGDSEDYGDMANEESEHEEEVEAPRAKANAKGGKSKKKKAKSGGGFGPIAMIGLLRHDAVQWRHYEQLGQVVAREHRYCGADTGG